MAKDKNPARKPIIHKTTDRFVPDNRTLFQAFEKHIAAHARTEFDESKGRHLATITITECGPAGERVQAVSLDSIEDARNRLARHLWRSTALRGALTRFLYP